MDGYLVLARCPHDDVPLSLFAALADAEAFVRYLTADGDHSAAALSAAQDVARAVFNTDVSMVIAVHIVGFVGGKPVARLEV